MARGWSRALRAVLVRIITFHVPFDLFSLRACTRRWGGRSRRRTWAPAGAAALLLRVAFLACWIPAHRAMRVDPLTALR